MIPEFVVIIPARHGSTRLPGKVLLDIGGKPLLQHVYESALASVASQVIIATDNQEVYDKAGEFNAHTVMTSPSHTSGTDRIAETVRLLDIPGDMIIVNLQGDELGMPPELINQVATILASNTQAQMATLCEEITESTDIHDPNIVKVVFDKNNSALYFSRSPIPWRKQTENVLPIYRHIGLYAYRAGFLQQYTQLPRAALEESESLEQLRALYYGFEIKIETAQIAAGMGIDTELDLLRARNEYV